MNRPPRYLVYLTSLLSLFSINCEKEQRNIKPCLEEKLKTQEITKQKQIPEKQKTLTKKQDTKQAEKQDSENTPITYALEYITINNQPKLKFYQNNSSDVQTLNLPHYNLGSPPFFCASNLYQVGELESKKYFLKARLELWSKDEKGNPVTTIHPVQYTGKLKNNRLIFNPNPIKSGKLIITSKPLDPNRKKTNQHN